MKSLLHRLRSHEGFSLVEVVVAVAIIGALVAVMASLLAQAARSQNRLIEMRAANNMMQTEVAAMDSTPWDDLMLRPVGAASICDLAGSNTRTSAQVVKPTDTLILDNVNFTVTRNIQWYTGGQQVLCTTTPNDRNDIKVVTITLTWYPDSSGAATRTSTLYVSKNKDQISTSHVRAFTPSAPLGIPDAPFNVIPAATTGQVTLTWTAPTNTGGTSITDYVVQYRTNPSGVWTTFADPVTSATGATVTGLTNATAYDFQIAAKNTSGAGDYSVPATATTP